MEIWPGECHVHAGITPDVVNEKLAENSDAEFLIHPECGCVTQFLYFAEKGDFNMPMVHVASTEGMVRRARSRARTNSWWRPRLVFFTACGRRTRTRPFFRLRRMLSAST